MKHRHYIRSRSREPRSTPEQMAERGFRDPRSHVLWRTGRVILKGQDKRDLRLLVCNRAGARCEIEWDGKRCNKFAPWSGWAHGELVHVVASSHGGSDSLENCLWGCHDCHKRKYHPGLQFEAERRRSADAGADCQGPA